MILGRTANPRLPDVAYPCSPWPSRAEHMAFLRHCLRELAMRELLRVHFDSNAYSDREVEMMLRRAIRDELIEFDLEGSPTGRRFTMRVRPRILETM